MSTATVYAIKPLYLIGAEHNQTVKESDWVDNNGKQRVSHKYAEQITRSTGFHNLPREVLVRVFSHFPEDEICGVLMQVCRHWRLAAAHPSLWRRLTFRGATLPISDVCRLLHHSTRLRSVQFVDVAAPGVVRALRQLCRCNSHLWHIAVKYCTRENEWIPESVLKNLIVSCHQLRSLNLKGAHFRTGRLLNELVYAPQLRSLKLGPQPGLRSKDLLLMAFNCRGLQELKLGPCGACWGASSPLSDLDAIFLFDNLQHSLQALSFDLQGLGEPTIQAILSCSQLWSLKLANCVQLSGTVFRSLPQRLPGLTRLRLANACQLTTEDVRVVFGNPGSSLRRLTHLDLAGCWRLRDTGLQCIADAAGDSLQQLRLERCKSVTAGGVHYLLKLCRNLRHLNIAHTFLFTPTDSSDLSICAPGLESLVLGKYDDEAITRLKQDMPLLQIAIIVSEFSKQKYDFIL